MRQGRLSRLILRSTTGWMLRVGEILPGVYFEVVSPNIGWPDPLAWYTRIFLSDCAITRELLYFCFNRGRVACFKLLPQVL